MIVSLVEAKIGNLVLVQGGFAIKVLTEKEAQESLRARALETFSLDETVITFLVIMRAKVPSVFTDINVNNARVEISRV